MGLSLPRFHQLYGWQSVLLNLAHITGLIKHVAVTYNFCFRVGQFTTEPLCTHRQKTFCLACNCPVNLNMTNSDPLNSDISSPLSRIQVLYHVQGH